MTTLKYGILRFDEPKRDTSRKIIHIDMDAFYASVEIRENPSLKKKPVVIAHHPRNTEGRGVVTTANYIAREYGIHSAMSSAKAYELCPHATFVPPNFDLYRKTSREIHEVFHEYTDLIQPISLDEAFLDVTDNKMKMKSATLIAQEIQQKIYKKTKLTCSAGVSYNKFIAKVASDFKKPSGITVIDPFQSHEFLMTLPINKFFGVGKKTVEKMHEMNIYTGQDLYEKSEYELAQIFGKMGHSLFRKVRGIDDSPVNPTRDRKSVGKETTFRTVIYEEDKIIQSLRVLSTKVSEALNKYQLHAKTVVIKFRYSDFETHTRRKTSMQYIQKAEDLFNLSSELWTEEGQVERGVRLLGITVTNIDSMQYENLPLPLWKRKSE